MTDEQQQELAYHLQELRADLRLIRTDLDIAASTTDEPALRRSWINAWSLLEHDLEVHLPNALALLGRTMPAAPPPTGQRVGTPASAAREARSLVDHAASRLPSEGSDVKDLANRLTDIAGVIHVAYHLADEMVKADAQGEDE
jgi:hypothetical protein